MQSRLMPINSSLSAAPRWSWDGLIHACLCFSEEIFCKLQNSTQEGSSSFCQEKSLLKKRAQQSWEEQFPHGTVLRHGDKEQRVTAGRRCLVCVWLADPQGKWKQKNLDQLQHECIGKNEWKHVVYESLRFCAQTLTLGRGQEKFTLTAPALAFSHLRLAHRLQTKCALPLAFVPARRNRTARRFEAPWHQALSSGRHSIPPGLRECFNDLFSSSHSSPAATYLQPPVFHMPCREGSSRLKEKTCQRRTWIRGILNLNIKVVIIQAWLSTSKQSESSFITCPSSCWADGVVWPRGWSCVWGTQVAFSSLFGCMIAFQMIQGLIISA